MCDYRKIIYKTLEEFNNEESFKELFAKESFLIAKSFFDKRYEKELKQYNMDVGKVSDLFIAKKNMNIFNIFIEELLFLGVEDKLDLHFKKRVRRQLRFMELALWQDINNDGVDFY